MVQFMGRSFQTTITSQILLTWPTCLKLTCQLNKRYFATWHFPPVANFINILLVHFSYESLFNSFPLVTFKLRKALSYQKCARKMLMTFPSKCQFHQQFMRIFYARRSQKHKRHCWLNCLFCAFGICPRKSCS